MTRWWTNPPLVVPHHFSEDGRGPTHTLTTMLAQTLPWATHLGTATRQLPSTAVARVATHLASRATVVGEDAVHRAPPACWPAATASSPTTAS